MRPEALLETERVLSERFGKLRLGEVQTLREDRCYRVQLVGDAPESAIVKMEQPEAPGATPSGLVEEWASLEFLNRAMPASGLVPELYGGSRDPWLVISEDLGATETVATALMGTDPDLAREALGLHAEAVADLHAGTLGKEELYRQVRLALGPFTQRRSMGWGDLREKRAELEKAFDAIGQSASPRFWDEYDALIAAIDDSAPFRAFVHNDSCPDNTVLMPGRVRLIDFEVGGYHTALLDAAYCRLCMPHCWLAQRLPAEVTPAVERRYRQRLAQAVPESLNDRLFGQRMTEACAYWLISNGTWMVHRNLEKDFPWGASTWYQRVLMRLGQFAETTDEFEHLTEMGHAARETLRRLRERWTSEPMPLYHAFR